MDFLMGVSVPVNGCLRSSVPVAYNLMDLISADSGWTHINGIDINNAGQIVGNGTIRGEHHTFLMTRNQSVEMPDAIELPPELPQPPPSNIPTPTTAALLSLGLAGFGFFRRKKV